MARIRNVAAVLGYGARSGLRKAAVVLFILLPFPTLAETIKIAALGDSLTQGYGLPQADGFVPTLQIWLQNQGADVEVVNAGVSGDTTAGGLSRLDWTLSPDIGGLIVALGGNDLLRGIDPAVSRANLDGILSGAVQRGLPVLLVGLEAPGNYGADYKADFDAIFPVLAQRYDTVYFPNFLMGLQSEDKDISALGALMQPDGIHPNKAGVALIVDAMGPAVLELLAQVR